MKKVLPSFLLIIFILILFFGGLSYHMSFDALTIWFEKLVPSMFVIMVLVKLLFDQGILQYIASIIGFILSPIFQIERRSCSYVIACIFLGFPAGASFINKQVKLGHLTQQEGQRLICTCSFATPGFVIMSCGIVIFNSSWIGLQLFLIQVISGLLLLFITRSQKISGTCVSLSPIAFMESLRNAVLESGKTLYMIGGYLMLFMSISAILVQFLPESFQLPLRILSEFSSGCMLLGDANLTISHTYILLSMLLSFGGFCVHMQVISMAQETAVTYVRYLSYRILQAIFSMILSYLWFM